MDDDLSQETVILTGYYYNLDLTAVDYILYIYIKSQIHKNYGQTIPELMDKIFDLVQRSNPNYAKLSWKILIKKHLCSKYTKK